MKPVIWVLLAWASNQGMEEGGEAMGGSRGHLAGRRDSARKMRGAANLHRLSHHKPRSFCLLRSVVALYVSMAALAVVVTLLMRVSPVC